MTYLATVAMCHRFYGLLCFIFSGTAERAPLPQAQDGGALYQDPNTIKRTEGPGGDMYAVADKPKPKAKQVAPTSGM